jgi:hypothetical protein
MPAEGQKQEIAVSGDYSNRAGMREACGAYFAALVA